MIKFNCLIHKETSTVIKYEDWLEMHYSHSTIELTKRCYDSDRMLFGNDFEIIYDSEFTTKELNTINDYIGFAISENVGDEDLIKQQELINKIDTILEKREFNRFNYGIEV
ncbi:hypothetical protein [Clostridium beijerinckii]|uniref:hypothetical protein n=1 Tax=Clostridium beijerinckii TaxID=1520 RepID=UPI0013611986|nr:hypothetical protein [Clostridium beijerinckii]MZK53638.1 hypothetical protein [Clostridium beijerinckii]MZK61749.1 hypothetical protein [Clostridium beijerinckii]MZK71948.1 hypothetical protein [Clostridium beijerinckii]MZK77335.1 hypothetical protein [Clostridium beijerinckii]MZK86919.1 hypothetical protein [Clostridium beijerinckii]